MKELVIKKCLRCGAMVEVLKDCSNEDCKITCCNEPMFTLKANSNDTAAVEKHVPAYEVVGEEVQVKVNHVMEDDHYIEWIAMVTEDRECRVMLNPGEDAVCKFKYVKGSKLYAYCNKHGLWSKEVE